MPPSTTAERHTCHNAQFGRAVQYYYQAVRLKPDDATALYNRCYAKASAGVLAEALAYCNEALRLVPSDPGMPRQPWLYLPEDAAVAPGDRRLLCGPQGRSQTRALPVRTARCAPSHRRRVGMNANIAAAIAIDYTLAALLAERGVVP